MILCPNCKRPFEAKAGKYECPEHGWHELNAAGEIMPADAPTPEELAAWQAANAAEQNPNETPISEEDPAQDPADIQQLAADPENVSLIVDDRVIYGTAIVIGLAVIGLAVYGMVKKARRAAGRV